MLFDYCLIFGIKGYCIIILSSYFAFGRSSVNTIAATDIFGVSTTAMVSTVIVAIARFIIGLFFASSFYSGRASWW